MRFVPLLALVLVGCASTAKHIRGPDGKEDWVIITCQRSQATCYERAGEECPNGYAVADKSGREGVYIDYNSGYAVPTYNGELLIKCK